MCIAHFSKAHFFLVCIARFCNELEQSTQLNMGLHAVIRGQSSSCYHKFCITLRRHHSRSSTKKTQKRVFHTILIIRKVYVMCNTRDQNICVFYLFMNIIKIREFAALATFFCSGLLSTVLSNVSVSSGPFLMRRNFTFSFLLPQNLGCRHLVH